MLKKGLALLLSLLLFVSGSLTVFAEGGEQQADEGGFSLSQTEDRSMPEQLTEEDIAEMNDRNVLITYSDAGYVSTIIGKYYEKKVTDQEEAIKAIQGLALLLGLGRGCEFFCVYGAADPNGYTYWTFQQRYGGHTLQYATLRVIVDPEGYTAALTSSFIPNVGIAVETETISPEEAEDIVLEMYPDADIKVLSDYTERLAVSFNDTVYNCYAVYTDNPNMTVSFNMPYLEHYITTEGEYVECVATNSLATSNAEAYKPEAYFEDLEMTSYTGTVTTGDGEKKKITVPVAYNKNDGLYYLADTDKKIMTAQYYDFCFKGELNFVTSETNDDWSDNNLLAYYNYSLAYDFYESIGMTSVDDFGTPLLITVGYCDAEGNPVNNACYYGKNQGWACFAVSDANTYSDALDVCAHEFTHAVTSNSMQGIAYFNEFGAINEAYSDIMGNLCEMMSGETEDTEWLIAEKSGETMRDMGRPNNCQQPGFVGDEYYVPAVINMDSGINDNGGVHINNSLIGHMAYALDKAGMPKEDQCRLWLNTIEMLTPLSDYDDLHALMLFSGNLNGIDDTYMALTNQLFEETLLNGDRKDNAMQAEKNGCGRISFTTGSALAGEKAICYFVDTSYNVVSSTYPDEEGNVTTLLPEGIYGVIFIRINEQDSESVAYTASGWIPGQSCEAVYVYSGEITELDFLTSAMFSGLSDDTSDAGSGGKGKETSSLTDYQGDFFTMKIPAGWQVEVYGEYTNTSIRVYDPSDPGLQFFFYGLLAPLFKSEAEREFWGMYDYTGIFKYAPIMEPLSAAGLLNCWEDCMDFQMMAEGSVVFPKLSSISVLKTNSYCSLYSQYLGTIDSVSMASCINEYDEECMVILGTSIADLADGAQYYGYSFPLEIMGTTGMIGTETSLKAHIEDMLACLQSITFDSSYIDLSYSVCDYGMPSQGEMTDIMNTVTKAIREIYSGR